MNDSEYTAGKKAYGWQTSGLVFKEEALWSISDQNGSVKDNQIKNIRGYIHKIEIGESLGKTSTIPILSKGNENEKGKLDFEGLAYLDGKEEDGIYFIACIERNESSSKPILAIIKYKKSDKNATIESYITFSEAVDSYGGDNKDWEGISINKKNKNNKTTYDIFLIFESSNYIFKIEKLSLDLNEISRQTSIKNAQIKKVFC